MIFYWLSSGKLEGLLCCHVDDFAWGGSINYEKQIINVLKETFSESSQESETFKYIGLYIDQKNDVISLHQIPYINELKECDIDKSRKELQHAKLTDSKAQQLRGLDGQLNWSLAQTCPDMSYHTCEVSTSVKDAKIIDLKNASKAIRKLKSSEVTLKFHNLGDLEKSSIVCFSDAAFTNLKNGGSQGAFIIFLYGNNKYAPIAWTSRKLKRVVKSTLSAETLALVESLETCFMIKSLLVELIEKGQLSNHYSNFFLH